MLNKNKVILIVFVCIFILAVLIKAQKSSNVIRSSEWYKSALSYIEYQDKLHEIINGYVYSSFDTETVLEMRKQAHAMLVNAPTPSIPELRKLLSSNDSLDVKVALTTIRIKEIYIDELAGDIIGLNKDNKDLYYIKFFSYLILNDLPPEKIKQFETELIGIVQWERSGSFILTMYPVLLKMSPKAAAPILMGMLQSTDESMRKVTAKLIKGMSKDMYMEIERLLREENDTKTLQLLKDAESSYVE